MAKDIFGYNKDDVSTQALMPPGAVILTIGGQRVYLAQSVRVNYQRETQPVYELGSENVYLVAGKSSGTVDVERMIGDALQVYLPDDACTMQDITVTHGTSTCGEGTVNLVMNGMLKSVGFTAQAGNLTVSDSAQFQIISLSQGS